MWSRDLPEQTAEITIGMIQQYRAGFNFLKPCGSVLTFDGDHNKTFQIYDTIIPEKCFGNDKTLILPNYEFDQCCSLI